MSWNQSDCERAERERPGESERAESRDAIGAADDSEPHLDLEEPQVLVALRGALNEIAQLGEREQSTRALGALLEIGLDEVERSQRRATRVLVVDRELALDAFALSREAARLAELERERVARLHCAERGRAT